MPKKRAGRKPVKVKADHVGSDWLLLTEIAADPGVQGRVGLSEEIIADYGSAMLEQQDTEAGIQFPPCIIFDDGTTKWLADGFHRFNAALRTEGRVDRLFCEIRQGTKRDAMLFALGANATHGLRPTAADKRKAVCRMLEDDEWRQWADREIARKCGVVHSYVGRIRGELQEAAGGAAEEDPEQRRTYVDKHGTKTTMKTGGRRKKRKAAEDDNDQQVEDDETSSTSSVAGPDLGEGEDHATIAGEMGDARGNTAATRLANGESTADQRVLEKQLEEAEEQIYDLRNRITALQGEIEDLQAIPAEPEGSLSEFQAATKKWEDLVETQKGIIAQRDSEIASLRAGVAAVPTGEALTLAQMFNRAVDAVALLDGMLSEGPDRWPKKVSARSRNQQINEVHQFLGRLRGFRDVIELYSGVSEEGQS
jgi:hypothetical protein